MYEALPVLWPFRSIFGNSDLDFKLEISTFKLEIWILKIEIWIFKLEISSFKLTRASKQQSIEEN